MKPSFSIIIPFYNAESTVAETLHSVENQTYTNFEVLLINDGSTDESLAIAEKWKQKQTNLSIHLISQSNLGLGAARNAGINSAKNDWVTFLDADDIWAENKLEETAHKISIENGDVFYHSVKTFGLEKEGERKIFKVKSVKEIMEKGNPIVPSATILERKTALEFLFSENRSFHGAEDFHLWVRLLAEGKKFRSFNKPLTFYRESGGMSTDLKAHLRHVFAAMDELKSAGYFDALTLARAKKRKFFEAGRFLQKRGQHRLANDYYSLADLRSMKIAGLRFLNFIGISI